MGLAVTGGGAGMDVGAMLGMDGELKRGAWQWEAPVAPASLDKSDALLMSVRLRTRQLTLNSSTAIAVLVDRLCAKH